MCPNSPELADSTSNRSADQTVRKEQTKHAPTGTNSTTASPQSSSPPQAPTTSQLLGSTPKPGQPDPGQSGRHVRQKRGLHSPHSHGATPIDGIADLSLDAATVSKTAGTSRQNTPSFSVSITAAFSDDTDSNLTASPGGSDASPPASQAFLQSRTSSSPPRAIPEEGGEENPTSGVRSLSAPSHLSTESQTALKACTGVPPLQNGLPPASRNSQGKSAAGSPSTSPGSTQQRGFPVNDPAASQSADEADPNHRFEDEEEEELSLAALPLKRPAPEGISGRSVETAEDSSEITFGGGAESQLRPAVANSGDTDLDAEAESAPQEGAPTQHSQEDDANLTADANGSAPPCPSTMSFAPSGPFEDLDQAIEVPSSDDEGSASGHGPTEVSQPSPSSAASDSPRAFGRALPPTLNPISTAQALELACLRLSTDPSPQHTQDNHSGTSSPTEGNKQQWPRDGQADFPSSADIRTWVSTMGLQPDSDMLSQSETASPVDQSPTARSSPTSSLRRGYLRSLPGGIRSSSTESLEGKAAGFKPGAGSSVEPQEGTAKAVQAVLLPQPMSHHPASQWQLPAVTAPLAGPISMQPAVVALDFQRQLGLVRLLLKRGKAAAALQAVEQLVQGSPPDPAVLCLRGCCLVVIGNNVGAFACFASALNLEPHHPETLSACGTLYKSCGLLVEAVESYKLALCVTPSDGVLRESLAIALTDLGTKLKTAGNVAEGMTRYLEAVEVCPTYAAAFYNQGVVHSEGGRLEAATASYHRAVDLFPQYAEAWCNLGVIYRSQGKLALAVDAYEKAQTAAPNFAIVHINLAIALTEMGTHAKMSGDLKGGMAFYEKALANNPQHADALYNMGVACSEGGDIHRAIYCYELALHFNPLCAEAHNNLGVIYKDLGNLEHAAQCYLSALQIRPNFPQGLNNLAVIYTSQGRAQEALQTLQAATLADPSYAEAYNNLGVLQRDVGAMMDALAAYDKCLELAPDSRNAGQNRLLALNYVYPGEDPMVCAAHSAWGSTFQSRFSQLPPRMPTASDREAGRRLTVGYICPDLFTHSVSYFAEAPLQHHSRDTVRLIVYSCVPKADSKTARLKAAVESNAGIWREVTSMAEADLADLVRSDGVDVLVELTGLTANNRLGVMAMRPAPVQVTWIGYPNSTGLQAVDYRLTDDICDPPSTSQTFVEELVRLPRSFLCYTPTPSPPPVALLPAASNGFITFGSFNALAKITKEVIRVWARIMAALPSSRLLLKNKPFACESARSHTLGLLAAEGVAPDRVDLLPLAPATGDHLATYGDMDISLDPWPYAGTTTTCESLFMGVPCITLAGWCHAHNVGVSLITIVGLSEQWVAHSEDEYVALALRAASDLEGLGEVRATLRERMLASPLCDHATFVPQLETVYGQLWQRWLDK